MLGFVESGLPQTWLPDETLFSLCSRFHGAAGNRLAATTCKALFGHKTQGCAHDFPARLDHFIAVAGSRLGAVHEIIERRTVLPLYLRFTNNDLATKVVTAAAQNSAGTLKFQLGLLTSRFRANHPLKACPACMVEDERSHATAYWHREHQLPGVWVCRKHDRSLVASDLKATGVSRFHWLLPVVAHFEVSGLSAPSLSATRLAAMVAGVVAQRGLSLSAEVLARTYKTALKSKGLLRGADSRLKHQDAGHGYAEFVRPLASLEQLSGLSTDPRATASDIARLIGPVRSGTHPLRHLALAAWLFRDHEDFLANYNASAVAMQFCPDGPATIESFAAAQDVSRHQLLTLLAAGRSVTGAAREIGIDTTTAMAWAASEGIATPRRPKVLKQELRATLVRLLRQGVGKEGVATAGGVSQQTITTLLRTEVGLHEAWKQAQFANAKRRHRRQWHRIIAANPLSGVKSARLIEPGVYAWLYRNDRDWLQAQTATMERAVRNPQLRVDWDSRDRHMANCVRDVVLRLSETVPAQKVRLFQIYQLLPQLKAKLSRLDRLPLTRAAIFAAIGRSASSCTLINDA